MKISFMYLVRVACVLLVANPQTASVCLAQDAQTALIGQNAKNQLEKDIAEVAAFYGNPESAKKLSLKLRQRWQQSEPASYVALSVQLAWRLRSMGAVTEREAMKIEARKISTALLSEALVQQDLRLRVFCLDVFAGLPYDSKEQTYSEEKRFEEAEQFLLTGKQLSQQIKELSTRTPAPKVDLSKYNWRNEVMIAGMKPDMIQDPVLRAAYASALRARDANRKLASAKAEANDLSEMFLRAFNTFAQAFRVSSSDDKTKLRKVLAPFDSSVGHPYEILALKTKEEMEH